MYYTIKIDSDIFHKCGFVAAIVYAHLLKVGADVTLKDLAFQLPFLTYRQIVYARNKLEACGLIENCYQSVNGQNCRQIVDKNVKELDKIVKRRHTARDKALLRARVGVTCTHSNKPILMCNYNNSTNRFSNISLKDREVDIGGTGEKDGEKDFSKREKPVIFPRQKAPTEAEEAAYLEKKEAEREARTPVYREIIDFFNAETGKHYSYKTEATQRFINARLAEGHSVEDFKRVIKVKAAEWKGTEQEKYLRPETLFRPSHFESYLNQPEQVAKPKKTAQSFDADEFMAAALAKSMPGIGGDDT